MSEDTTPRLGLPMIIGGQAQKHLTLNETLSRLDALLQARVKSRTLSAPPASPVAGDCYLVPAGGSWSGFSANTLVRFDNGLWEAVAVTEGTIVFVSDETCCLIRHGSGWKRLSETLGLIDDLGRLGVGAQADNYNVLAVKGGSAWMGAMETAYGGNGSFDLKLNKDGPAHTAALAFQQGWSSRAVMGLLGNNSFSIRVTPDGSSFTEALTIQNDGQATLHKLSVRLSSSGRLDIAPQVNGDAAIRISSDAVRWNTLWQVNAKCGRIRYVKPGYVTPRADLRNGVTSSPWFLSRATDNNWLGICWSSELGLWVAVAASGTGNRVMYSRDGVNWSSGVGAPDNDWRAVCWSPERGLFVAVASTGTGNRVMTSADGINWTARVSAADNFWSGICWSPELGLLVAVSAGAGTNRVMTSPDGINWTGQTALNNNLWRAVCWVPELGLFVAVASSGTGNRVMTSADGINWTAQSSAADNEWWAVCWSPELGLLVAVAGTGTGNRVMTSPDGINWTLRSSAADVEWRGVCWSPEIGLFAAVARTGTGGKLMTSADGISWTGRTSASTDYGWACIAWSGELGLFVSAGTFGGFCMTSVQAAAQASGVRSDLPRIGTSALLVVSSDTNITLTTLIDAADVRHTGTLTAARTLTLATANAYDGARFRITRTGAGAFNLSVGGLKNLATNTWCEVTYSASAGAWYLSQYGAL